MIKEKYINSPVAVIGIASYNSRSAAQTFKKKYKVDFPNGIDLAGATFALWSVPSTRTFGFVLDENGKIIYRGDMASRLTKGGKRNPTAFERNVGRFVDDAKDPFGIDEVPEQCKQAYALLKVGRFGDAKLLARRLLRSSAAKAVAKQIIDAADKTETEELEHMKNLANDGRAGELYEEYKAFLIAFPRTRARSKLRALISKAGKKADGKKEATAAKNYDRALALLARKKSQGLMLMKAIGEKYEGTPHGDLSKTLSTKLK